MHKKILISNTSFVCALIGLSNTGALHASGAFYDASKNAIELHAFDRMSYKDKMHAESLQKVTYVSGADKVERQEFYLDAFAFDNMDMSFLHLDEHQHGMTDLMRGILSGKADVVMQGLRDRSTFFLQVNVCDSYGRTSLMYAAKAGHVGIVQFLMSLIYASNDSQEKRYVVLGEREDKCYLTALKYAIYAGHRDVVDVLLEHECERAEDACGRSLLMYAAAGGHVDLVRKLLDNDKGKRDACGHTALVYAVCAGHVDVVKELFSCEEERICDHKTLLMHAAERGNLDVIDFLLSLETEASCVGKQDAYGMTAMMHAIRSGNVEAVRKLAQYESQVQDANGKTALMHAVCFGHLEIVKELVASEAGYSDIEDNTALMYAVRAGRLDIVRALAYCECRRKDKNGMTAMMHAARTGSLDIVRELVCYEARMQDKNGMTAMMHAVDLRHSNIVSELSYKEHNMSDNNGKTALLHAIENGLSILYTLQHEYRGARNYHDSLLCFAVRNGACVQMINLLYNFCDDQKFWLEAVCDAAKRCSKNEDIYMLWELLRGSEYNFYNGWCADVSDASLKALQDVARYQYGDLDICEQDDVHTRVLDLLCSHIDISRRQEALAILRDGCNIVDVFIHAAACGHVKLLGFLSDSSDVEDQVYKAQLYALSSAARKGHAVAVSSILKQIAVDEANDIIIKDVTFALQCALARGHSQCVEAFLKAGGAIADIARDTVCRFLQGKYLSVLVPKVCAGDGVPDDDYYDQDLDAHPSDVALSLHDLSLIGDDDAGEILYSQPQEVNEQNEQYSIASESSVFSAVSSQETSFMNADVERMGMHSGLENTILSKCIDVFEGVLQANPSDDKVLSCVDTMSHMIERNHSNNILLHALERESAYHPDGCWQLSELRGKKLHKIKEKLYEKLHVRYVENLMLPHEASDALMKAFIALLEEALVRKQVPQCSDEMFSTWCQMHVAKICEECGKVSDPMPYVPAIKYVLQYFAENGHVVLLEEFLYAAGLYDKCKASSGWFDGGNQDLRALIHCALDDEFFASLRNLLSGWKSSFKHGTILKHLLFACERNAHNGVEISCEVEHALEQMSRRDQSALLRILLMSDNRHRYRTYNIEENKFVLEDNPHHKRNRGVIHKLLRCTSFEQDSLGRTALMYAAAAGDVELVQELLQVNDQNSQICGAKDVLGRTALMHAAFAGHNGVVKVLSALEWKERRDNEGKTAMMYAAIAGHRSTVELLWETEKNMLDNAGMTAAMHALRAWKSRTLIEFLLQEADNKVDNLDRGLMMHAVVAGRLSAVRMLKNKNIACCKDIFGRTELMYAAYYGHLDIVRLFLDDQVTMKDSDGKTALMYAVMAGNWDIVHILRWRELQMRDSKDRTVLMYAAYYGHLDIVRLFLDEQVTMQDSDGKTALMYAVMAGHLSIVKKLLVHELSVLDNEKKSAYEYAMSYAPVDVAMLLYEHRNDVDNAYSVPECSSSSSHGLSESYSVSRCLSAEDVEESAILHSDLSEEGSVLSKSSSRLFHSLEAERDSSVFPYGIRGAVEKPSIRSSDDGIPSIVLDGGHAGAHAEWSPSVSPPLPVGPILVDRSTSVAPRRRQTVH